VTRAGIAVTALVAICSAPIMIAALAAVLLGERPTPRLALALGLGVAGTALLVARPGRRHGRAASAQRRGVALGAGLAYALLRRAREGRARPDGAAAVGRAHLRCRRGASGAGAGDARAARQLALDGRGCSISVR